MSGTLNAPGLVEDFLLSGALTGIAGVSGTWQLLTANHRRPQHRLMLWTLHSLREDDDTLWPPTSTGTPAQGPGPGKGFLFE